jgi:hypothetical protein
VDPDPHGAETFCGGSGAGSIVCNGMQIQLYSKWWVQIPILKQMKAIPVHSVSYPDPHWIRIANADLDPDPEGGKSAHKKDH